MAGGYDLIGDAATEITAMARDLGPGLGARVFWFAREGTCFFEVGTSIPRDGPEGGERDCADEGPEEERGRFLGDGLRRLQGPVHASLQDARSRIRRGTWPSGVLNPELDHTVGRWHEFFREQVPLLPVAPGRGSARQWSMLGDLLRAVRPVSALGGDLRGIPGEVYRVAAQPEPESAWRLDWAFPGPPEEGLDGLLEHAFFGAAVGVHTHAAVACLLHEGLLEGFVLLTTAPGCLDGLLEPLAALAEHGARVLHEVREHVARVALGSDPDLKLRVDPDCPPAVLVLKHLPKLLPIVAGACVARWAEIGERGRIGSAMMVPDADRPGELRLVPELTDLGDRADLVGALRQFALRRGRAPQPVPADAEDPEIVALRRQLGRVLDAEGHPWDEGESRSVCAFDVVDPATEDPWSYLLFLRRPPGPVGSRCAGFGAEITKVGLRRRVRGLLDTLRRQLEAAERLATKSAYSEISHVIGLPLGIAASQTARAARAIERGDVAGAGRILARTRSTLRSIHGRTTSTRECSLRQTEVDLAGIVREHADLLEQCDEGWMFDLAGLQPVTVRADRETVWSVALEVLENAGRAATAEQVSEPVRVCLVRRRDLVGIEVRNRATGLDEEFCRRLMSAAARGVRSRSARPGGSGFGLVHCYEWTYAMQGEFLLRFEAGHAVAELLLPAGRAKEGKDGARVSA